MEIEEEIREKVDGRTVKVMEQEVFELNNILPWKALEETVDELMGRMYPACSEKEYIGGRCDKGGDVFLYAAPNKKMPIIVQVKKRGGGVIDPDYIRVLVGTLKLRKVRYGIFITNTRFGPESYNEAEEATNVGYSITLMNGRELANEMVKYRFGVKSGYTPDVLVVDYNFYIKKSPDMLIYFKESVPNLLNKLD